MIDRKSKQLFRSLAPIGLLWMATASSTHAADVDFLREVRPILINRCYRCHSSLKQESNFRLDAAAALEKGGDGGPVIVPGKSVESRLVQAIEQRGELKMPPEGDPLAPAEIALVKRWIDEGAKLPRGDGARHWSFAAPKRLPPPAARQADWPLTAVDAWIAARRESAELAPSAPAPQHVFLRRLTLDLIGLPPSDEELADYVADRAPDATERVTDRLLAHPAHGQRWGRHWMDVWRYSDWDGYGAEVRESQPHIWRWRDWIIESVNADKPYNQMLVEMLAGDEIAPEDPQTTRATGFLVRNWFKFNRNVWLDNTVEHMGKAFVGLTFNCARCHDHMYDPVSQHEYYQLRAIFEPYDVRIDPIPGQVDATKDGVARAYDAKLDAPTFLFTRGDEKQPEQERPLQFGLPRSLAAVPLAAQVVSLGPSAFYPGSQPFVHESAAADASAELAKAESGVEAARKKLAAARAKLAEFAASSPKPALPTEPKPVAPTSADVFRDDFAQARPELWTLQSGKWEYRNGRLLQLDPLDTFCSAVASVVPPQDFQARFRFRTTGGKVYRSVGMSFDMKGDKDFQCVYLSAYGAGPKLQYAYRLGGLDQYPAEAARPLPVELDRTYELQITVRDQVLNAAIDGQTQLAVRLPVARASEGKLALWTYDATAEFLNVQVTAVPADYKFVEPAAAAGATPVPVKAVANASTLQAEIAQCESALADVEVGLLAARANAEAVAARIAADRAQYQPTPAPNAKELALAAGRAERQLALRRAERAVLQAQHKLAATRTQVTPDNDKSKKALADAEAQVAAQETALTAAQTALEPPNDNYARFSPLYGTSSSGRRLALGRWIASNDNPLTPRVAANHVWLRHFGSPIVATMFDFGANGKPPTHPELLDWLARELVDNGWEMKRLHRTLVTSAVYRQASSGRPSGDRAAQIDPENRLAWKMNVRRMEAEQVRDATLFVSGQLDRTFSGPDLDPAAGMTLPRRSVYFRNSKEKKMTFLSLFDSPNVSECYRRSESIAPQQALALANSSLSFAQARILAGKFTAQLGRLDDPSAPERFVEAAFQRVLGRSATVEERTECLRFLTDQAARFASGQALTAFGGPSDVAIKPSPDARQRARENLVHVLLNHNDFVAIR